jgi:hypothetical protein
MVKRLLVVARDFNTAQHWAKNQHMSPGYWVYVSSYHNIQGNAGCEYTLLDNWKLRPDAEILKEKLVENNCVERNLGI